MKQIKSLPTLIPTAVLLAASLLLCRCAEDPSNPPKQPTTVPSDPKLPISLPIPLPPGKYDDLEVTGAVEMSGTKTFNLLYLTKDSKIVTKGEPLEIRAREIVSKGGVIETLAKDSKAKADTLGRSGGGLRIFSERASGDLQIFARGEAGGDGSNGSDGPNGSPGVAGSNGRWEVNQELYKKFPYDAERFQVEMEKENPVYTDYRWKRDYIGIKVFVCSYQPSDGGPGKDGGDGASGANGKPGGNSSAVYLHVLNADNFTPNVSSEPGMGGSGGKGGKHGTAGRGGPPGELDRGHLCNAARPGTDGRDGADGRDGFPGSGGSKEPVCTIINGVKSPDCGVAPWR